MSIIEKSTNIAAESVGQRIDLVVRDLCELSRAEIAGLFDHSCVTLNGAICQTPATRVVEGDRVELRYDQHQRYHAKPKPPKEIGFGIAFEDDHVIVVNKPPQLLTVPTPYGEKNTLISRISAYLSRGGKKREAFVCHRLDRGVSGLLVFGKALNISMKIRDQFELRKPQREYVAIVAGSLKNPEGTFRSYLATDANLNRFSTDASQEGQLAITHYRVISALDDATLLQIWLETGRRNQIRVHFAEAGHPVLGDPRYDSEQAIHARWPAKRIALHARSLGFEHPVTGQGYRFECDLPGEFVAFIKGAKSSKAETLVPTLIAIAVVEHEDHFLVGQRGSNVALAGYWEFPGGKVEAGETPEAAAVRECREETGVDVAIVSEYPRHVQQYDHDRVDLRFFACRPIDPNQPPQFGYRWVTRAEMLKLKFPSGNRGLLELLAQL